MCNIWHYVLLTARAYNRYICQYLDNKDKSLFITGVMCPRKKRTKTKMKIKQTLGLMVKFSFLFLFTAWGFSWFQWYFFQLAFLRDSCENWKLSSYQEVRWKINNYRFKHLQLQQKLRYQVDSGCQLVVLGNTIKQSCCMSGMSVKLD